MEMESSRRSLDRSKEPGLLKKPRLIELAERDPRAVLVGKGPVPADRDRPPFLPGAGLPLSRSRPNAPAPIDRDSAEAAVLRGGGPSFQQQQQQMQELAVQYKTALAELTFNSKPIITNLTIIAGENLPAAKAIAAVICANILEVPSEQKLPSLYLLDSIVKNIGRDYIKYFASRLPEVFCRAYKMVDTSVHQGMRHLFGTWKGVFPPAPLQAIEKELSFQSVTNGPSTGGTISRPEPPAQRPPHSIHVNPKYLEARREQLQQPTRMKAANGDSAGKVISGAETVERADKVSAFASSRQWSDPSIKGIQRPQRELSNESAQGFGDREFSSEFSRLSSAGRFLERGVNDKAWSTVRKLTTRDTVLTEGPASDASEIQRSLKSSQPFKNNKEISKKANSSGIAGSQNWKNSEEEEYTWDLGSSRLMDSQVSSSWWTPEYMESALPGLQKARTIAPDDVGPWNQVDSVSPRVSRPLGGNKDGISKSREVAELPQAASLQISNREHSADVFLRGAALGHRSKIPSPAASNNARLTSNSCRDDSYPGIPASGQYSTEMDLSSLSTLHGRMSIGKQPQYSLKLNSTAEGDAVEPEKRAQQLLTKITQGIKKPPLETPRSSVKSEEPFDESSTSKLLEAIAKSGLISSISSSNSSLDSFISPLLLPALSEGAELPPLPPGPRPLPFTGPGPDSPPLSSLLSSLVAKGLISSATEPSPASPVLPKEEGEEEKNDALPSLVSKGSVLTSTRPSVASAVDSSTLIGLEFKPGVLREYHPEVINHLYPGVVPDDEEMRFDSEEQIRSHFSFNWMFCNPLEPDSDRRSSRRWYPCLAQFITRCALVDQGSRDNDEAAALAEEKESMERVHLGEQEKETTMVPADEGQCICGLCGEPFEDVYSEERDEWMYAGAVYYSPPWSFSLGPPVKVEEEEDASLVHRRALILHANCRSSSTHNTDAPPRDSLQLADVKMELEDS